MAAPASHVLVIALIAVATWLGVRCIGAIEASFTRRFSVDAADNLRARRVMTQVRVLARSATVALVLLGAAAALMTVPGVRNVGASLLASAGLAGLVVGLAAKPVLSNLLAGLQIALAQPIRLDDVVIIEGEWGRIEEITGTYVVVRIWDQRRLVVPLNWFIENPVPELDAQQCRADWHGLPVGRLSRADGTAACGIAAPVRGHAEVGRARVRTAGHRCQRAGGAGARAGELTRFRHQLGRALLRARGAGRLRATPLPRCTAALAWRAIPIRGKRIRVRRGGRDTAAATQPHGR